MDDEPDAIDVIIEQWRHQRPDLDLSGIGVFGRIMQLSLVLGAAMERACSAHGLRGGEFDVLTTLRRSGPAHTLTPSELADSLMMSRAGITKRLDRLEQAGLVERSLDAADRRSFRVTLSEHGREVIDTAMTEHAARLTELSSSIPPGERETLERSLRHLLHSVVRGQG